MCVVKRYATSNSRMESTSKSHRICLFLGFPFRDSENIPQFVEERAQNHTSGGNCNIEFARVRQVFCFKFSAIRAARFTTSNVRVLQWYISLWNLPRQIRSSVRIWFAASSTLSLLLCIDLKVIQAHSFESNLNTMIQDAESSLHTIRHADPFS